MADDKKPEIHNVTSHDQSGGITAHTVNIDTKTQRRVTAELEASFLKDLPNDRPVRVFGMNGNSESMNFANEIYQVLESHGYTMLGECAHPAMIFSPPIGIVKISEVNEGAEWGITVGPAK